MRPERRKAFDVNETENSVLLHEVRAMSGTVLFKPGANIMGDADIQRAVVAAARI
jgi:hypothetical protein